MRNKVINIEVREERTRDAFIVTYVDFLLNDELDVYEKMIYQILNSYAVGGNTCYPSVATIAKILKISTSTVERRLRKMEKMGYIKKEQRFTDKGQTSNLYTLYQGKKNPDWGTKEEQEKSPQGGDLAGKKKGPNGDNPIGQNINKTTTVNDYSSSQDESQVASREEIKDEIFSKIDEVRIFVNSSFTTKNIMDLLKAAGGDVIRVKRNYDVLKRSNGVIDPMAWLINAIKEDYANIKPPVVPTAPRSNKPKAAPTATPSKKPNKFNNFQGRDYSNPKTKDMINAIIAKQFQK